MLIYIIRGARSQLRMRRRSIVRSVKPFFSAIEDSGENCYSFTVSGTDWITIGWARELPLDSIMILRSMNTRSARRAVASRETREITSDRCSFIDSSAVRLENRRCKGRSRTHSTKPSDTLCQDSRERFFFKRGFAIHEAALNQLSTSQSLALRLFSQLVRQRDTSTCHPPQDLTGGLRPSVGATRGEKILSCGSLFEQDKTPLGSIFHSTLIFFWRPECKPFCGPNKILTSCLTFFWRVSICLIFFIFV